MKLPDRECCCEKLLKMSKLATYMPLGVLVRQINQRLYKRAVSSLFPRTRNRSNQSDSHQLLAITFNFHSPFSFLKSSSIIHLWRCHHKYHIFWSKRLKSSFLSPHMYSQPQEHCHTANYKISKKVSSKGDSKL
jgi:hypothetical protein